MRVLAFLMALIPGAAMACPHCAASGGGADSPMIFWLLGSMILLPFPTAAAVAFMIHRSERDDAE